MKEQNLPKPITPERNSDPAAESGGSISGHEQRPDFATTPEIVIAEGDKVNQAGPAPQYSSVDLPQAIAPAPTTPATTASKSSALPMVADEVDVIEKAWVDKAKTIVKQTKDDPYAQENQVSSLQEDYQEKRYGQEKPNR